MQKRYVSAIALAVFLLGLAVVLSSCRSQKSATSDMYPQGAKGSQSVNDTSGDGQVLSGKVTIPPTGTQTPKAQKLTPPTSAEIAAARKAGARQVTITTSKGTIEIELAGKEAPMTVANFVKLAQAKFYDGLTWHRVVKDFVIQGGDPNGDGSGGPGYNIKLEISKNLRHTKGAVAMARATDPDSAGSQFYITLTDHHELDDQYAVFGKVVKGMDVAGKIAKGDKIESIVVK